MKSAGLWLGARQFRTINYLAGCRFVSAGQRAMLRRISTIPMSPWQLLAMQAEMSQALALACRRIKCSWKAWQGVGRRSINLQPQLKIACIASRPLT